MDSYIPVVSRYVLSRVGGERRCNYLSLDISALPRVFKTHDFNVATATRLFIPCRKRKEEKIIRTSVRQVELHLRTRNPTILKRSPFKSRKKRDHSKTSLIARRRSTWDIPFSKCL